MAPNTMIKYLLFILTIFINCPIVEAISLQGPRLDDPPVGVVDSAQCISLRALQRYCELADSTRRAATAPSADGGSSTDSLNRIVNAILDHDTLLFAAFYAIIPFDSEGAKAPLLRLKTNAVGWALLNSNLTVEYAFADHWAASLPVYWGTLDYFTSTVKLRTLALMPEVRYYTRLDEGLFVGLHVGVCYYSFALGGTTRFQDHDGNEPALGGGFTAGYIMPLGKSHRWNVEYSLGAGVYRHHYDKFYNYKNGPLYASKTKTALYVDHLAVTFSYTFDFTKRHAH
jgi:hypothetical protein